MLDDRFAFLVPGGLDAATPLVSLYFRRLTRLAQIAGGSYVPRWYYTCPAWRRDKQRDRKGLRKHGSPGTEGRKIVVSKTQSLRWLENLRRSQRLTAREERRKEEIIEIFRELYDISVRHENPPDFPPWRPSW